MTPRPFDTPMPMPGASPNPEVTTAQALAWFVQELEGLGLDRMMDLESIARDAAVAEVRRNGLSVKPPENTQ